MNTTNEGTGLKRLNWCRVSLSPEFMSKMIHNPLAPLIIWVQISKMKIKYESKMHTRTWLLLLCVQLMGRNI